MNICKDRPKEYDVYELLMTITENMLDMIGLTDIEGNFIFAGKVHEVLGYEPCFLIGKNVMDLVHHEDFAYLLEEFSQLLATGVSNAVEYRYRKIDGSYLWFETVGKVVNDENGTPHQIVFNARDITARKRTEDALCEREELNRTILNTTMDGFFIVDTTGCLIEVNETYCEMSGYDKQELLGLSIHSLEAVETSAEVAAHMQKVMIQGEDRFESRHRRKDGSVFDVEVSVQYWPTRTQQLVVFIRDITDRKKAEEEIETEARLRNTLLDNVPNCMALILKKHTHEIVASNKAAAAAGAVPGKTCFGTCAEREERCSFCLAPKLWTTNSLQQIEVEYRGKWYEGVWAPFTEEFYIHYIFDITGRKQTEEALKNRELTLNKIFDVLPIGLWFADKNGKLIKGNPAGVEIWGAEPTVPMEEYGVFKARRLPQEEEIAPDDWALAHTIKKGTTITDELLEIDAFDGRKKIILNYTAPVMDDAGGMLGAIVVNNDITARWQAEKELRESEARYRELVENTNSIILRMDLEGRVSFLNDYAKSFFGYEDWEIIGRNVVGTIVPERDSSGKDLRTMIADIGKHPERYALNENENMKKDGTRLWVCWSNKGVLDEHGKIFEILCVGNDATARREAEQLLQISEKRVRAKLDAVIRPEGDIDHLDLVDIIDTEKTKELMDDFHFITNVGGAIVDLEGNVVASTEFREICAQFHRVHPDALENCIESDTKLTEGIEAGQFRAYKCKNNMRDIAMPLFVGDKHFGNIFIGQFFYDDEDLDYNVFRSQARKFGFDEQKYLDALDRVPRFSRKSVQRAMNYYSRLAQMLSTLGYSNLKLARALEEQKQNEIKREQLQEQLNQAQKMESVGRLAGGVAHDFNNKLAIINGYAEMAADMIDPSDPLHETIREIHTAGMQSAGIVRQLLAFARQQTISPVELDLNDSISSMLKMFRRLIGENIDLAWHPGANLWPVKIDPSQVDQIMANLAVNSRDAIPDVGKLTIETKNTIVDDNYSRTNPEAIPGRYVTLSVSDDGCGIEKGAMDHLFEPYYTTKEVGKGTGLGLPTIYGILKQNKGFVNVYSEPGQGTTFRLYFPSSEKESTISHSAEKSRGKVPMGSETILLVEDEPAILKMGREMIRRLGYTVLTAENPSEAMKIAGEYEGTIHLLITDVVMPEMNGRDLSAQLTKTNPGIKTLYMSGYTANVIAHHGVLDEGVQFIQKPFSMKDLAVKVRETFGWE